MRTRLVRHSAPVPTRMPSRWGSSRIPLPPRRQTRDPPSFPPPGGAPRSSPASWTARGSACGHTLVSLFDGDHGVRVDRALGLPGGVAAARGLRPSALARLARLARLLGDLRPDLVLAHGGDAFRYLALATRSRIAYCVIAVTALVQVPPRRHAMGQAARDRCVTRFALPVVADRWEALFTLMVSARDMRLPRAAALEPMRVH